MSNDTSTDLAANGDRGFGDGAVAGRARVPKGSPHRRSSRPTAADVARRAGLSKATVSYVLNDTPHQVIPEPTRQRVLDAAAALGYTPSAAARALRSGRSDVVLMLLPDWPLGPSVGRSLEYLSAAFARQGLTFVIHPRSANRPIAEVWKAITPAAVLTYGELEEDEQAQLTNAGIAVSVALFAERQGMPALVIPEQRSGRLQAEHLAFCGHRTLAYALPHDPRLRTFSQQRLDGVRQACADLGLDQPAVGVVHLDPDVAANVVRDWRTAGVTGVCAYNDEVAMAVLAGARQCGVEVPADLAVVGVDDIPAAALTVPSLTTVSHDQQAIARYIADSILRQIVGGAEVSAPGSDIYTVVRRSSA